MQKTIKQTGAKSFVTMASSAAVMIGALLANQTYAQESATESQAEEAQDLEEVVVYGIKQSLKNAQDIKRDASTVVDVITASDITSLPDKSVVDALSRVPGVTVEVFEAPEDPEHFGAEGSTALIRGLNRTLTQFNGRTSFSATQWGSLNLGNIPSELVGAIEVQKNQTASMIEGGIAGTLNIITRKPFDSPGLQAGGSLKMNYADLTEQWFPELSGLVSNRWDTDFGEVGALVSVAMSEIKARSEGVGIHNFYEKSSRQEAQYPEGDAVDGVGTPLPGQAEGTTLWVPPSFQARAKNDERERFGLSTSLQWASNDDTVMATLEFIHSSGRQIWSENLVQNKDSLGGRSSIDNRNAVLVAEIPGVSGLDESFNEAGLLTHGVLLMDDGRGYEAQTRYHNEKSYVNDISLDVEFAVSDQLTLNTDLQYVDSGLELYDHTIHNQFDSDVWVDLRESGSPQFGFLGTNFRQLSPESAANAQGSLIVDSDGNYWGGNTASVSDPNNIYLRSAMDHNTDSSGEALAFALEADYELEDSWITNIKAGVRFSDRSQVHKSTEYDWGIIAPEWSDDHKRTAADYPQFQETVDFGSDFHGGDSFVAGSPTTFYFPRLDWARDLNAFEDAYRAIVPEAYDPDADFEPDENGVDQRLGPDDDPTFYYSVVDDDGADHFITNERLNGGQPYAPSDIFTVDQEKSAAFVQLDYDFMDLPMPIRGNIGLRYVSIDLNTTGFRKFDALNGDTSFFSPVRVTENTDIINFPADLEAALDQIRDGSITAEEAAANATWLNGYREPISVNPGTYSSVLPSFNFTMNISDDLLLRGGISKAVYIPHLSLNRAGVNLSAEVLSEEVPDAELPTGYDASEGNPFESLEFTRYTAETIAGSNPFLKPEESINADLSLEWYFSDVGSITGVVFTKQMENLIRKATAQLEIENPSTGVTQTVSQTKTYDNVGDGTINGIELAYQQTFDMLPGPLSGLGIQANYTQLYTDEDVKAPIDTSIYGTFTDLPIEGLSKRSYNFIVFYENEKFNTRLAYNFRSEYMLDDRDVIADRPVYNADRAVLDYSFTYNIIDQVKAGITINNLLDTQTETKLQYTQAGNLHPRNYFINDRRMTFFVSGSF